MGVCGNSICDEWVATFDKLCCHSQLSLLGLDRRQTSRRCCCLGPGRLVGHMFAGMDRLLDPIQRQSLFSIAFGKLSSRKLGSHVGGRSFTVQSIVPSFSAAIDRQGSTGRGEGRCHLFRAERSAHLARRFLNKNKNEGPKRSGPRPCAAGVGLNTRRNYSHHKDKALRGSADNGFPTMAFPSEAENIQIQLQCSFLGVSLSRSPSAYNSANAGHTVVLPIMPGTIFHRVIQTK